MVISGQHIFKNIDSWPQLQSANSSFLTEAKWKFSNFYGEPTLLYTATTTMYMCVRQQHTFGVTSANIKICLLWVCLFENDTVQLLKWCVHPFQNPLCFDHGCHLQTCLAALVNRSTKLGVNRRGQISGAFPGRGPNERQAEETVRDLKHGD